MRIEFQMSCSDTSKRCKDSLQRCKRAGYDCMDDGNPWCKPIDPPRTESRDVQVVHPDSCDCAWCERWLEHNREAS